MILFLDLDGTVIGSNGVSDAVYQAIEDARIAGAQLAVCTGRPRGGVAQEIAQHMSPTGPHIFESGAMVAPAFGTPWSVASLDKADLLALAAHAQTTPAVLEFYTPDGVFVSDYNEDCRDHERVLEIKVSQADLTTIANTHDVVRAHWIMRPETVEPSLSTTLISSHIAVASSPVLPKNVFASITKAGTDKGTAANFVLDRLGLTTQDAWTVGDSIGDLPILRTVGRGFVMAEATAELREEFEVLPSVNQDGIIKAINKFLLKLTSQL